ncbi:MAG: 16S rRNA (cytidine(1402)-2'-O)-methyltransferase, partial [Trinickia sp.]
KLHEAIHRCTLAEGPTWLAADANRQRGEFVLVVQGASEQEQQDETAHDALLSMLLEEVSVSAAARLAASITGTSRNALYSRALELSKGDS